MPVFNDLTLESMLQPEDEDEITEALAFLTFPGNKTLNTEGSLVGAPDRTEESVGFLEGIIQDIEVIRNDPIRGLPVALETAGAVLGGVGLGGFGAPLGAFTGRLVGETVESFVRDTPLITGENAFETLAAPVFSLPLSMTAGAAKSLLSGAKKKLSRSAATFVDPFLAPHNIGDMIKKAEEQVLAERTAQYITRNEEILARTVRPGTVRETSGQFLDDPNLGRDVIDTALRSLETTPRYIPEGMFVLEGDPVGNTLEAVKRARDRVAQGKVPGTLRELLPERIPEDEVGAALEALGREQNIPRQQQAPRTFDTPRTVVSRGADAPGETLENLLGTTAEGEGLGIRGRGVGRVRTRIDTSILDDTDYVGKLLTRAEEIEKKQSITELSNFFGIQDEVNRALQRLEKPSVQRERTTARLTMHRELAERKAIIDALPKITPSINSTFEKQKALIAIGAARNVPGAGPLLKAGKQIGLGEDLFAMSRVLTKFENPEAILALRALETGSTFRRQVDEMLNADLARVFEKYGLRDERLDVSDHVVFNILHDAPELRAAAIRGELPVEGFDPDKVSRIAGFIEDVTTDVRDKELALARRSALNPADPSAPLPGLPDDPVNRNIFASTSISGRNVDVATDDLHRAQALLDILPQDDPMADILRQQLPALQRQMEIAQQAHLGIQRRLSEASEFAQKTGAISKDAFAGAFQASDEQLLLGSDLFGNYQDYIAQLARKTALDNSQAVVAGAMKRLGDVDLLSQNLALDQLSKLTPDEIIQRGTELSPGLVNSLADEADLGPLIQGMAGIMAKTPEIRLQAEQIIRDQRPLREYLARASRAVSGQMRQTAINHISDTLRRLPGGLGEHITPEQVSTALQTLNNAIYVLDIGLNPRFLIQNFTQPLTTLMPTVGMDTFAQAFMDVMSDFPRIAERAHAAGSIIGNKNLAEELGVTTATGSKLYKAINFLPETTEKINRVLAHRAGEIQAAAKGLTGDAAQQHAKQIVTNTNFGLLQTDRPLITNHPLGSILMRFRSFLTGYSTLLAHLAKTDKKAFADAVVMMTSMSGSTGIPLYDFFRDIAAEQTGEFVPEIPSAIEGGTAALVERAKSAWPELDAVTQLQALDMGQSFAFPWQVASDPSQFFGPAFGPIANIITAIGAGDKEKLARSVQQAGGPLVGRLMQTVGQVINEGETRTPGGTLIGVRDPIEIAQTAISFRPSVRQERAQIRRDLEIALQANDSAAVRKLLKMARARGLKNIRQLVSQAKSNLARGENTSALGVLFGL